MPLTDQLLAVGFVLCLLCAAAWALGRKRGMAFPWPVRRTGGDRTLKVLERLPLSGQHALHLVKVGHREVLIGTYPAGLVFEPLPADFQDVFGQVTRRQLQDGGGQ